MWAVANGEKLFKSVRFCSPRSFPTGCSLLSLLLLLFRCLHVFLLMRPLSSFCVQVHRRSASLPSITVVIAVVDVIVRSFFLCLYFCLLQGAWRRFAAGGDRSDLFETFWLTNSVPNTIALLPKGDAFKVLDLLPQIAHDLDDQ
jgi:hypothetical protein